MKYIKALLAFALIAGAQSSAYANEDESDLVPAYSSEEVIRFSYYSTRSAYHCDFVRLETAAILRHLGAKDVFVDCSGGLPYTRENFVEAKFTSTRLTTSEKSTRMATMTPVMLGFTDSCDLHERIVRSVIKGFDTFDFNQRGMCNYSRGRLSYEMSTLR